MNWSEALAYIESPRLDAELNFASGTSAFFRGVSKDPGIQGALRLMSQSGEVREAALDRIHDLAMAEVDSNYQNPNDTALAVLLWLTYFTDAEWARFAANYVERAPRCWYANRLSQLIVNPAPTMSSDSWKHPDGGNQISYRSSSRAESLNVMSTTAKCRFMGTPSIGADRSSGVETGRQAVQWATGPGIDPADRIVWLSGYMDTGGVSNLSAAGWAPTGTSALATGDRT